MSATKASLKHTHGESKGRGEWPRLLDLMVAKDFGINDPPQDPVLQLRARVGGGGAGVVQSWGHRGPEAPVP